MSKNGRRTIWTAVLVLVLTGALSFSVYGAGTRDVVQAYRAQEGVMRLLLAPAEEGETYQENCFALSLSGQDIPVTSLETLEESGEGMTIYCLVDVSGSMGEQQMEGVREVLGAVCGRMRAGDRMAIGTLGNTLSTSGYMSDTQEIMQTVNGLTAGNEDTNLYAGIVEGLKKLKEDVQSDGARCLLILSDGRDEQKSGITQAEAEAAVRDSDIPVYTVAALRRSPDERALDDAKLLGSFARMSAGGRYAAMETDDDKAGEIGEAFYDSMLASVFLYADISGVEAQKDVMLLRVSYTASDAVVWEDSVDVYGADIISAQQAQNDQQEDTERVKTDRPEEEKQERDIRPLLIVCLIVFFVAAATSVVLVMLRKKRKAVNIPPADPVEEKPEEDIEDSKPDEVSRAAEETDRILCEVSLTAIGYEGIRHRMTLQEGREVTVGRTNKADIVLMEDDRKLSGVHCGIRYEKGKIYVRDAGSANGTYVNGVSIRQMGRVVVHKGDTLRIGSYEYRIG